MRNQTCDRSIVEATKTIKWTGKIIDLVEVIYAICEDASINGGNVKLNNLFEHIGIIGKNGQTGFFVAFGAPTHSPTDTLFV